jgi:O-methyltransferase
MTMTTASHEPARDDYLELLKKCLSAILYEESGWKVLGGGSSKKGVRRAWKRRFYERLARRGIQVVETKPLDVERRLGGEDWPMFGYTMVGHKRLDNLEMALRAVHRDNVPGDVVETGVWRGGASIFMKAVLHRLGDRDRTVWLADSFEGLPKPTDPADIASKSADLSEVTQLKVSLEQVQANFRRFDLLDERVKFLKGWFADTLPTAPIGRISVLRLDGDLYESTRDAVTALGHKVSPGGFVIVDDYVSWPGCRQASTEYRAAHGITAEIVQIDNHGVYWRVPASS